MSPIEPLSVPPIGENRARALAVDWAEEARKAAFDRWLTELAPAQRLVPGTLCIASADASFRRYLRIDRAPTADDPAESRIVMDAPPEREDCRPFVRIAKLMEAAGLNVPQVLAWNEPDGFLLLTDLGDRQMMQAIDPGNPPANRDLYLRAVDALIDWQLASKPGVLPPYDEALLRRELALFPDWYIERHKGIAIDAAMRETLSRTFDAIVARNLEAPSVFVHRDFMPRNLMLPSHGRSEVEADERARRGKPVETRLGVGAETRLGVLDFQDAVHGPVTYDIACLMRDAFLSWDEDFVLDITVRYWERAKKAGLIGAASPSGWGDDFGEFYRAVEWMGLQRHLKVAGIFARLTLRDGKPKYLADAPRFIGYIRHTASRYRELTPLLRLIDKIEGSTAASGYAFGRV
ncbi:MAG: phosphotransferase [Burkholderiales bacterium]